MLTTLAQGGAVKQINKLSNDKFRKKVLNNFTHEDEKVRMLSLELMSHLLEDLTLLTPIF